MSTISRTAFWAQSDGIHKRLSTNSGSRWGFRVWQLIMNSRSRWRSISSIWMLWILCRSCAEFFGSRWISRPLRPKLGALLVTADANSLLSARSTSGKGNMFGSLIKRWLLFGSLIECWLLFGSLIVCWLLFGSLIVCWLLFRTEIFSFSRRAKSSDKRKFVNNEKKSKNCSKLQESDHIGHNIEPSTDHQPQSYEWLHSKTSILWFYHLTKSLTGDLARWDIGLLLLRGKYQWKIKIHSISYHPSNCKSKSARKHIWQI